MRAPSSWLAGCATAALLAACGSSTDPHGCMTVDTPCLSGPPNLTGVVTQVAFRPGQGAPGSSGSYDIWLALPPSAVANAAVIVDVGVTTYLRVGAGPRTPSTAATVQTGDRLEAWVSPNVFYGSPDAPPAAAAYGGAQLLIAR